MRKTICGRRIRFCYNGSLFSKSQETSWLVQKIKDFDFTFMRTKDTTTSVPNKLSSYAPWQKLCRRCYDPPELDSMGDNNRICEMVHTTSKIPIHGSSLNIDEKKTEQEKRDEDLMMFVRSSENSHIDKDAIVGILKHNGLTVLVPSSNAKSVVKHFHDSAFAAHHRKCCKVAMTGETF